MASLTHGFSSGSRAVPRGESATGGARGREPRRHRAHGRASSPSTAAGSGPARWRSRPRRGRWTACASSTRRRGPPASPAPGWTGRNSARRSTRPRYLAGHWHHDSAILDPARLAWGLARACEERGVRIFEGTPVTSSRARARRRRADDAVGRGTCAPRRARHQRVPAAAPPAALARHPRVRLRADDGAADARTAGVHRLAAPAGAGGRRLHVPLLPAHRGPAHPLGRLGRALLPRPPHPPGVRGPARPVRQTGRSLLHDLPPTRGAELHAPLGGRDRHVLTVLPVLGNCAGRARLLRPRLHRAGSGRFPLRCPGGARPRLRPAHRAHGAGLRALAAAAVPAGAAAVPLDRGHAAVHRTRGAARRPAQRLSCSRWTASGSASTPETARG